MYSMQIVVDSILPTLENSPIIVSSGISRAFLFSFGFCFVSGDWLFSCVLNSHWKSNQPRMVDLNGIYRLNFNCLAM